ncbi:uncharacterized protein LOC110440408 isoform X1 [Mizuhopecten yessoensis]|uniref:uncharacterized protein LOC110440408 isoform X1 n=1 Tax=Mizuhopecten yessoensis TaxID=6573 RepID=UPI000B45C5F9|nr:uncharacterized protein LOC110440408 isoform X1 [Mizuhopecten yessoensis]
MADRNDLEKKRKAYEDALQIHDNIVGIIENYDEEPENILRAKRAMLHYICQGMDPKEKEFRKKVNKLVRGEDDIPRHDDVYKFEEDQDNQDSTDGEKSSYKEGRDVTDSVPRDSGTKDIGKRHPDTPQTDRGTENTDQEPRGTAETDRDTEITDQEPRGTAEDDFRYTIGKQRRLAVYIGVRQFEKRGSDGESDGTGVYDDTMNREREEKRDRSEARLALKSLGFTFKRNPTKETTKEKVDKFIETVLTDDENKKVDIIVVLISSHGEEVKEQDEHSKDKNVLRHRILLEDKYLYTDELLKRFNTSALKGIPKLFFIQACRSGFGAKEEDVVDKGVGISVEVQGNSELEKDLAASRSNGHRDISDARPRNLKPKVTTAPQPGTEVADDTKEANTRANVPHVKPPVDTPPEGDKTVNSRDDVKSHNDVSDARPRNQTSGLTNPQSSTLEPIQNAGGAKPLIDIATESEEKQSMDTPEVKDNSVAKKTSDLADVRQPKPDVDTTLQVVPQQEIPSITCIEDSLVMFASAPGKEAYRRSSEGGWMMQSVIKELESWPSHPDQDLLQVLTKVIGKIAIENETDKGYKSAACLTHMLIKDVYLC